MYETAAADPLAPAPAVEVGELVGLDRDTAGCYHDNVQTPDPRRVVLLGPVAGGVVLPPTSGGRHLDIHKP